MYVFRFCKFYRQINCFNYRSQQCNSILILITFLITNLHQCYISALLSYQCIHGFSKSLGFDSGKTISAFYSTRNVASPPSKCFVSSKKYYVIIRQLHLSYSLFATKQVYRIPGLSVCPTKPPIRLYVCTITHKQSRFSKSDFINQYIYIYIHI